MLDLASLKLAIVGTGKLGEAILAGLLQAEAVAPEQIVVTARRGERARGVAATHGCRAVESNAEAVRTADVVLLCVKPFTVASVLAEIAPVLEARQLLISVAAGVTLESIQSALPAAIPVIRAMPNTPALRNAGMTAIAPGRHAREAHLDVAEAIFRSVGRCLTVEERHMDAVTGLSASGPAFIYVVIESMAEAGVKIGLPRDVATELAAQTVLGSAKMVLETGEHPAKLKDLVTTPAGCTVDGLLELEAGGLRVTIIKAIVEAARRAGELARG